MISGRGGLNLIGIPHFILRVFNPFSKRANWIERRDREFKKWINRRYFGIERWHPDTRYPALINDVVTLNPKKWTLHAVMNRVYRINRCTDVSHLINVHPTGIKENPQDEGMKLLIAIRLTPAKPELVFVLAYVVVMVVISIFIPLEYFYLLSKETPPIRIDQF